MAQLVEPGAELLLFRLADRGYACPRAVVRDLVDVGGGLPPVDGLGATGLAALEGTARPVAVVSMRLALGLPDRGPDGRILVVETRLGPVGFLVDEVVRVVRHDPAAGTLKPNRFGSGYVTGRVDALGASWLLVDWNAIRLPAGLTAR